MKRAEMVRIGADKLINTENSITQAFCDTTDLLGALERMRLDSRLSMVVGQQVVESLTEVISSLASARSAMVRAHGQLDDIRCQIGCRTVAAGTILDKPSSAAPLQIVENERNAA
jgi:hypothetical protein